MSSYSPKASVNMDKTSQKDAEQKNENLEAVAVKRAKWSSKPAVISAAVLSGIFLAAVTILSVYAAGMFDSGPELPNIMEGEATFQADDGKEEVYHVIIDYQKKLVQFEENHAAKQPTSARKIVLQDYSMGREYLIVLGNGEFPTKCLYTGLEGFMIPRNLLKRAALKSENVQENNTHTIYKVGNDTEIDVYRAKGNKRKIHEVYFYLPNGTMHMRSKAQELNFTDYEQLNCYKYIDESGTIEEPFYQANDSKLYEATNTSTDPTTGKSINLQEITPNLARLLNETPPVNEDRLVPQLRETVRRRRRGIGWRNGKLDWWYGNWCGPNQGGYSKNPNVSCKSACQRSTIFVSRACRGCLPPQDVLDEACMEHDRCTANHGRGPWWCQPIGNHCKCDRPFVQRVNTIIQNCTTNSCRWHALQVYTAFQFLSCWYPQKTCFPSIRVKCRCILCLCPKITTITKCVVFKKCSLLGSGKKSA